MLDTLPEALRTTILSLRRWEKFTNDSMISFPGAISMKMGVRWLVVSSLMALDGCGLFLEPRGLPLCLLDGVGVFGFSWGKVVFSEVGGGGGCGLFLEPRGLPLGLLEGVGVFGFSWGKAVLSEVG